MSDATSAPTAFIGTDGKLLAPLPSALSDPDTLQSLYRRMVLARTFDAQAVELQRTGRLGTYASSLGQEAVGTAVAHVMRTEDVLLPSFRDHPAQLGRGVTVEELLLYWGGDERGSDFAVPREDFPVGITVGGHAPQAAGVALAFRLRGESRAALCMLGDGATSKGDFYEALNAAGLWELPVVFVVSNNQWAISTPRSQQTAARTLAQKSVAAGFPGEQVDGNDVVAVADVVGGALDRARTGGGPTLVECLTYRLADHTTVDDASRYRDEAEVRAAWERDPVARLRLYLGASCGWSEADEEALLAECEATVKQAAGSYLECPPQPPESIFDFTYAELPADLESQRAALKSATESGEDSGD